MKVKYLPLAVTLFLVGCHEVSLIEIEQGYLHNCIRKLTWSESQSKPATIEEHKYCVEYAKQKRIEEEKLNKTK